MQSRRTCDVAGRWWRTPLTVALLVFLAACGASRTVETVTQSSAVVTSSVPTTEAAPVAASPSAPSTPELDESAEQSTPPSTSTRAPAAASDREPGVHPGDRLRGRTFRSVSVSEHGEPKALVAATTIKVQFEAGSESDVVGWRAGCNTAGAPAVITADRLRLGSDVGSTAAGCDAEREEQEEWVTSFFLRHPYWHVEGSRLSLAAGDIVIELEEVPADDFHG